LRQTLALWNPEDIRAGRLGANPQGEFDRFARKAALGDDAAIAAALSAGALAQV